MVRSATTSEQQTSAGTTTGVRLDLPTALDDRLDRWAERSRRSKKEHATFIVEEVTECYERDPLILHWLGLIKTGQARVVLSGAGGN